MTAHADLADAPATADSGSVAAWPLGEVVRDIARGGLAGLVVGLVVAGLGGRIVMRLAALAVPASAGAFTENGNRIGDITLGGSLGLILFVGLLAGIYFGVVWVVISPWLPGRGLVKGLVAMPIAVALGAFGLIDRQNVDFLVLRRDPLVVAILIVLVASIGPAMAVVDGWLDRRLPRPETGHTRAGEAYVLLAVLGIALGGLLEAQALFGRQSVPLGVTVLLVGLMTLAWWRERYRGRPAPSRVLTIAARATLVLGTVAGFAVLIPEAAGALGLGIS